MDAEERKLADAARPLPTAENNLAESKDSPNDSGVLFAPMKRDELVSYHTRSFRLMFAITSVIAVNALIVLASHYLTVGQLTHQRNAAHDRGGGVLAAGCVGILE